MSKGTKKLLTVGGLLVLVVGLGLLYYFIPKGSDGESASSVDTKEISLNTINEKDITKITIERKDGKITLSKTDAGFVFANDKSVPVDEEKLSAMISALAPVKAIQEIKVDNQIDTAEYGLDDPSMVVTVETNGQTFTCTMGTEAPVIGGYYAIIDNESKIYAISDEFYTAFDYSELQLTQAESFPSITADYVTGIHIENTKAEDFQIKLADEADRVETYNNYNMLKPYKKTVSADQTNITTYIADAVNLVFKDLVEYNTSDMKKYGLAKPWATITIDYYEVTGTNATDSGSEESKENKQCVLYIGKQDADGNYYVNLKGSKGVYTMEANTIMAKTNIDAFTYADHCIYVGKINDLNGFDLKVGKKTMKVTCKTETEGDTKTTTYSVNGKQISADDESDFLDVYSAEFLLEYSGVIDQSVKPKSNKEVMSIVYHQVDGKDITIKYYPYDGTNFYRVEKNGTCLFLTDKRGVDDVAERFMKYNK